ncbi:aminotransferase class I/II-fold pyridoxal phosphate-dependent enzyme [Fluoribacter dumoffii]|uniref:aminotransferase class I/II-fold pyridoxal phosphate-dependent enzyme n=1 Tax=Fluoribacter dumoffii TaxID=463 RepID=UPI002244E504|nr:aminotransferase class I/II-fold pyridoxal phosphate-dependent enzyme [Fluoribacter dumoffii]MCW8418167.1 aminotransferase class I/II-fold pyridoxal phosphate-dependent enzyme [Fluoribacter dumoffii]MCW8453991.1 aminotransferase class I/II-fold pyridoxal phosphate-dependent enzyme [Fluoribacter dumoffii]MCW8461938.1 aminotransferase class I/II-fold pyridoxal phosphate-dependent enzyme [Fluoribacter dumoffii]MCW8482150.1 aminotransferase class I/II-fold pyridoxal phosphate-dependent enzyme [F
MMSKEPLTIGEIEDFLQNNIANILNQPKENIDITSPLINFGFDSLHIQHFIADIEDGFQIQIDNELIINFENIRELAHYLLECVNELQVKPDLNKLKNFSNPKQKKIETTARSDTDFKNYPPYLHLKNMQAQLGDNIFFDAQQGTSENTCLIDGKEYINFTSYNYLGLASHPEVISASCEATRKYGTSVSASRLVSGQKIIHQELENELAALLGVEDALVFTSGHATNVMTIAHLYGPDDLILHDELAHNSLVLGAVYSQATRMTFPHNDWEAVETILTRDRGFYKRVLIIIEGVYSMDGDISPLKHFINVKNRHAAWLMIDEAHSMGVLGKSGKGISEHYDIDPIDVEIWMGTLSKSFASCGGYIAGKKELIEYLKYTCPGFVFSVGLSPANTAAALSSIKIMAREPARIHRLHELSQLARETALQYGFNIGLNEQTPILPIILGDSQKCIRASRECFNQGINVKPIIYPAVPENSARLRFFITAIHTPEQILKSFEILSRTVNV